MISKDTIALVRDRTDIVAVVSESVPSLKKRGRRFLGLCPFHKEKTPSFNVNPDTGVYHCFGCKESGDVFTFLQKADGYTFPEAVRALAERAGIVIEEERGAAPSEADRHKKEREALYGAMNVAAAWYEEQLRTHPQQQYAIDELARRELAPDNEAVQAFRVGYAPSAWDGLASFLKKQGISPAVAESVGLLVPRSSGSGYYDRFRHRLMFAVIDTQGRVVAFSGRALAAIPGEDGDAGRDPPPKYINSPESPIYTKGANLFGLWQARHAIRQKEHAIVVEGNFDVVSLHARGVENVVAPLGTAFTEDQAKLLRRYATAITSSSTATPPGRRRRRAAELRADAAGLDAKVAVLPDKTDPDDFVRDKGVEALRHLLEQRTRALRVPHRRRARRGVQRRGPPREGRARRARRGAPRPAEGPASSAGWRRPTRTRRRAAWTWYAPPPMRSASSRDRSCPQARAARIDFGPRPSRGPPQAARPGQRGAEGHRRGHLGFPRTSRRFRGPERAAAPRGQLGTDRGGHRAARIRMNARGEKVLDTAEFLAQMPDDTKAFASARLAAPMHETIEEALRDGGQGGQEASRDQRRAGNQRDCTGATPGRGRLGHRSGAGEARERARAPAPDGRSDEGNDAARGA